MTEINVVVGIIRDADGRVLVNPTAGDAYGRVLGVSGR
jgi:hypothetical protein